MPFLLIIGIKWKIVGCWFDRSDISIIRDTYAYSLAFHWQVFEFCKVLRYFLSRYLIKSLNLIRLSLIQDDLEKKTCGTHIFVVFRELGINSKLLKDIIDKLISLRQNIELLFFSENIFK